ncbi:MAG: metallophosphoesterase [Nitrospiraceae bacterium]|nr:metallophosphoesterase [Nitrospiraceae bacterium]
MSIFLITFFSIYSLMHLYLFLKAKAALSFGLRTSIVFSIIMLLMITAPLIVRAFERAGHQSLALIMAYTGYIWLAAIFLFCSISSVMDFYRLLISIAEFISKKNLSFITLAPKSYFIISAAMSLMITFYGYFEAKNIRTEKIIIRTSKIPKEIGALRIVQISDVHLGLIIRDDRLKLILNKVKYADPDIFISTGDLVDGYMPKSNNLENMIAEINPRYGKFAITGNHEFYAGLKKAIQFTEKTGFKMLRDEAVNIAGIINIVGIDDPAGKLFNISKVITERELLSAGDNKNFTLLLKHRPAVDKNSIGLFDLQISGHVHKGQIFPFSILTWLYYPVHAGFSNISDISSLYVSRGTGTWGPPIRFLASPEVTVIELVSIDH